VPDVRLVNVTKRYGKIVAVDNVNIDVKDGEYFTLLGPSGCGKTTTMRAIAGLLFPDEGDIYIGERVATRLPPEDRDVGLVFQHFEIFPFMTVLENVAYGPNIRGWKLETTEEKVWKALEITGLADRANAYPRELGAPGLQRCGIARVLAIDAKLLLFDEPIGSMDSKVRMYFRYELRRVVKESGLTAVHVTHDQEEAMVISDRIAVMRRGRVLQVGSPMELYNQPNSPFVANFVGESDFLVGHVKETFEGGCVIQLRGGYAVRTLDETKKEGQRVVVSVRCENFKIRKGERKGSNVIHGTLTRSTFMGPYVRQEVLLDEGTPVEIKEPITVAHFIKSGEKVSVSFKPEQAIVYTHPENLLSELALE
jgi:ABC-type Fe3+/spermidine/putrescine transport system ATPase subunit